MNKSRVVVGLSGGVDSSVTALLLLEQGYDVHGVFMKNWEDSFEPGYCAADEDLRDAEDVCETLNIPLHKVNFSEQYRQRVFTYFLAEYQRGRTPNPDVLCNKEIKFRAFLDHSKRLGADYIATGHYARLSDINARQQPRRLLKGLDYTKDQSYFLHALNQQQLENVLFPVGELQKSDVRELARQAGLVTYDKKDSTGICFIGERDFREFLGHYLPTQPGPMQTPEGEIVGEHQGLMFYTHGQRQGLGIGGRSDDSGEPWYVVGKDLSNNILTVVQGTQHPLLYRDHLHALQVHWINGAPDSTPFQCRAKTRYRQADQVCTITRLDTEQNSCEVVFEQPQRAITPGQSVVFYQGDECLGGAIIDA